MSTALCASRAAINLVNPPVDASLALGAEAILNCSASYSTLLSTLGSLNYSDRSHNEEASKSDVDFDKLAALTAKLEVHEARRAVGEIVAAAASASHGDDNSIPIEVLEEMLVQESRKEAEAEKDFDQALAEHEERVQRRVRGVMEEAQAKDELARSTRAHADLLGVRFTTLAFL